MRCAQPVRLGAVLVAQGADVIWRRIGIGFAVYLGGGLPFFMLTGWPGTGLTFLILGVIAGWTYPWDGWWERIKGWFL